MPELAFNNPAGGLRYHLRALRYGKSLWQPFRWALGEWLLGWQPPERSLLLVGPSGGYCLQPFVFERFERIVCLEPDPVARLVFAQKLSRAPLERRPKLEFLSDDHLISAPEKLPRLLETLPDTALLFSNIIGQLRVLLGTGDVAAPQFQRVRAAIRESLTGRSWASFHDRVSGWSEPQFAQPLWAETRLTDAEVLEVLYGEPPSSTFDNTAELLNHQTSGIFPDDVPHSYFSWELLPSLFHVIEAVAEPRSLSATPAKVASSALE